MANMQQRRRSCASFSLLRVAILTIMSCNVMIAVGGATVGTETANNQIEDASCNVGNTDASSDGGTAAAAAAAITVQDDIITPNLEDCIDKHDDCSNWARDGECDFNPKYMLKDCPQSCQSCQFDKTNIEDEIQRRTRLQLAGGDERYLETPYGMIQDDHDLDEYDDMNIYMEQIVFKDSKYEGVRDRCKNKSRQCAAWKRNGECETNPLWMNANCAPYCETCLLLDYDNRCPLLPNQASDAHNNAIPNAGDLNKLFERIMDDASFQQHIPQALSRPSSNATDLPWIVVLDNFLTDEECQSLVHHGTSKGYEVSTSLRNGVEHQKRVSTMRTSTNTWCDKGCLTDDITQGVLRKMEQLTGIPQHNSEHLQLLRYEPGQQCFVHNDYLDYHKDRQMGVRVLTVFLYLSDVEEGGGTYFPNINSRDDDIITVEPKKGRVVIWPSVQNEDPHAEDVRTNHGSWAVDAGIKYGANAFIHQRDVRESYTRGCF